MKGSRLYIAMMLLLAAGLPVGCSHDAEPTPRNEIAVTTRVTGLQQKRVATINNNTALHGKELRIDAYFYNTNTAYLSNTKLVYSVDHWRFDDGSGNVAHYYWPIEGSVYDPEDLNIPVSSLDFVGFCPYEKPSYIGTPTYNFSTGASFTCNMSGLMTNAAQAETPEYLIAVLKDQTLADQEEHSGVPLEFKHPCALIKFVVTAASGTSVQVNSISIADLYTNATCTYDGTDLTWGSYDDETKAAMTITQTLKVGGTTESATMMVIPKNYGAKTLTVNGTWTEWSKLTKEISADVAIDWQPGYIYTYNLTVTKYALQVDVNRYTEQW